MNGPRSTQDRAARLKAAIQRKRLAAAATTQPRLPLRPSDQAALLGALQRSLWVLHQLDPGSPAYNLTSAFRVAGDISLEALGQRFDRLIAHHRLLRSTFSAGPEGVRQIIHSPAERGVEHLAVRRGEALEVATREARVPFDLETGPLIRLLVIEENDDTDHPVYLLVLVLHHILADERSLAHIWQALVSEDEGASSSSDSSTPQYDDFVAWRRPQDGAQEAAALAYWRHRLETPPDDLGLPFERPRGATLEPLLKPQGRLQRRALDSRHQQAVRQLATATGTTPFAVFAFAFRVLLHRYTEGRDIAFATPVSQRIHADTAHMIGYFLNPVVMRQQINETLTVSDGLSSFNAGLRDAMSHPMAFDALVEALAPPRHGDQHPIFQTMFVYQETPAPPLLEGRHLEPVSLELESAKFDLTLFASESSGGLEIAVEYRSDRYDDAWMTQLLDHYQTLISNLPLSLDRALSTATMLNQQEDARLRAAARGPALTIDHEAATLLPHQILAQVMQHGDAPAVLTSDETWSYGQLARAAAAVAKALAGHGVGLGDRVGLFLDRSPWMIAGLLGCHWAGAAYVPLDPAYPSARNVHVLDDADVAAVLSRTGLRDQLPESSPSCAQIDVDTLSIDGLDPAKITLPALNGSHTAYLLFTSGSTGRPKGVVVSHANLHASNSARLAHYGRSTDEQPMRFLLLSSIAFDSSVAGLFWTLATGGALVLPSHEQTRDPQQLATLIADQQVTDLLCVPSLYGHLLAQDAEARVSEPEGRHRLESLQTVIVAGEACSSQLASRHLSQLPGARLVNEYGPTEATVWASVHDIETLDAQRSVAIGRPIPGVQLEVLDALGRRVPAGIPGQGFIAGPTLASGYWQADSLTAERFAKRQIGAEPEVRMYATGDRLTWTLDGRLLFLGRLDGQLKVRGFRIEPDEIETALLETPGVVEAVVVLRPPAQLVAFVQVDDAQREDAVEDAAAISPSLRSALGSRLPVYMVPSRFVVRSELPRLPNGKINRQRLMEIPLPDAPKFTVGSAAGAMPRERALIDLWQGLLGLQGITPSDNFFQLGGHSLQVVEMATAISRDFAIEMTPADIFQNPTIEALAQKISQHGGAETPPYAHLFPLQPGGHSAPFLFCVPHFFSRLIADRFRGERPVYGLRGVSLRAEGNRGRWPTMPDLGAELVDEIRHRFGDQPCIVAGYSFGATMAVEATRQLEAHGISVERLILIAPMPVATYRLGPFKVQLDFLRQPVSSLSPGDALGLFVRTNHPLSARPYQRLKRWLFVQPVRRIRCFIGRLRQRMGLPLTPGILNADVRLERFRLHSNYQPGSVRSPTVVFNAQEPATDAAATWRPYFEGPVTVHQIPDPHGDADAVEAAKAFISAHLQPEHLSPGSPGEVDQ